MSFADRLWRTALLPLGLALTLGFLSACGEEEDSTGNAIQGPVQTSTTAQSTVYYVIRHTERDPGEDPPINAEGMVRAERLADALEGAGIEEIVTTSFVRGTQSGQPLADRLSLNITVAPFQWEGSWPAFATSVGTWQRGREIAGRTYLMIGHSGGYNTQLLQSLGAILGPGEVQAEDYQDLALIVREPDGTVRTSWLQYGGASSLD